MYFNFSLLSDEGVRSSERGRLALWHWLFNSVEEKDEEEETLSEWKSLIADDPQAVAALIWSLVVKNIPAFDSDHPSDKSEIIYDNQEDSIAQKLLQVELVSLIGKSSTSKPR